MAEKVLIKGMELEISTTADFHHAYISLRQLVEGGDNIIINSNDIVSALNSKGIKYNIDEDKIQSVIEKKVFVDQIEVAVWTPPVDGIDGTISYKYPMKVELVPQIGENGKADYKNLGYIRSIDKGSVIAEITLPTDGTSGMDVRGVEIRQKVGRAAAYRVGENVVLTEDGLRLEATESGHLEYSGGVFNVKTSIVINQDIDAEIGNIDFVGDVTVNGYVTEGFKVASAKNITVKGNVNGATLEAGGDIVVKNGVINSKVTAHGSFNAQFCEHSNITADGGITANDFVFCTCYSGGELHASRSISGGKYTCLNNGYAGVLGTENYAKTEIVVGDNALIFEEKNTIEKRITELNAQVHQFDQIIEFLKEKAKVEKLPPEKEEMRGKVIKSKYTLLSEKKMLNARIAEIDERLAIRQALRFDCKKAAYHGVKINISGSTYNVTGDLYKVSFHLNQQGEVEAFPL